VKDLSVRLFGSGLNVTTDNFFTSHNLAQFLLTQKTYTTWYSQKKGKEVPRELVPSKRAEYESVFAFTSDAFMVSYLPKKNKTGLLLSTMHEHPEVDTKEAKKPFMILDYNATKRAVDAFDQQVG